MAALSPLPFIPERRRDARDRSKRFVQHDDAICQRGHRGSQRETCRSRPQISQIDADLKQATGPNRKRFATEHSERKAAAASRAIREAKAILLLLAFLLSTLQRSSGRQAGGKANGKSESVRRRVSSTACLAHCESSSQRECAPLSGLHLFDVLIGQSAA
jgi:hypothetical protein